VTTVKQKLKAHWRAWLAFGCALVGGVTATATWLGDWIANVVGVFWWWVPLVLLVVVGLTVVFDLAADWIPNRKAIYCVILWPSLAAAIEGKLGRTLRGWTDAVNAYLDRSLGVWLTDTPRGSAAGLTAVALMTIAAAVLYAEKYAKKAARPRRPPQLGPAAANEQPRSRDTGLVRRG
jgi:hypothetical protein